MPFGLKTAPPFFQRKMDNTFGKYKHFILVYIDDILVFSNTMQEHLGHLQKVFNLFIDNGLIISKKKMELCKTYINFLGITIGEGKIKLQPHIAKKILEMPDKLDKTKELQKFLGMLNYARHFIKDLGKVAGPLYAKTGSTGQKFFNIEDIKLVQKLKDMIKTIPDLQLLLESDYLIIETDGCDTGWGAILKARPNKYSSKKDEKLCAYNSGQFKEKGQRSSIDLEVLAVIYGLNSFRIYIINKPEVLVRTDCEAIVKFYQKIADKHSSTRRWLNFINETSIYNLKFEHIKGIDNNLADQLSRLNIKI